VLSALNDAAQVLGLPAVPEQATQANALEKWLALGRTPR
jgi:hypothetical protein